MARYGFMILMVFALHTNAQNWQWARAGGGIDGAPFSGGGAPWESYINDMATDKWGNVYAVGSTYNGIQFSGTTQTFTAYGAESAFIVKYDKCGNFQWAIINGGAGDAANFAIAIDSSGYIYVGGAGYSDNNTVMHIHTSVTSDTLIHNTRMVFTKCDPNGNLVWLQGANYNWTAIWQDLRIRHDGKLVALMDCGQTGGNWQSLTVPVTPTGVAYSFAVIDPQTGNVLRSVLVDTLSNASGSGIVYHPFALDDNDNIYITLDLYNFTSSGQSFNVTLFGQQMIIPGRAAMLFKLDKNLNFVKSGYDDNGDAILSVTYSEGALYTSGAEFSYCNYLGDTVAALTTITAGGTQDVYRLYKLDTGTLAPVWESSPLFENSSVFESYVAATSKHVWMSASNLGETIWGNDTIHLLGAGVQQYLFKFDKATGHCDTIYVDSDSTNTGSNLTSMIMTDNQENVFIGGQFNTQFTCGPNTLTTWGGSQSPIFYIEKFGITCADSINTADNPYPPTNLITTTGGISSINLQWTYNSPYRISFHIYRSPNGINNWQLVDTVLGAQTTLVDTGLTSNTWYWYKVAAWNMAGESDYSNIDSAKTLGPIGAVSISGQLSLCANTVTGVNYTTATVTGATYAWSITGGTITQGNNTNSILVTWGNTGPYQLKLTECLSGSCSSDSITITIKPLASTTFTQTICQGQVFDGFTATGTYIDTFTAANSCDSIRILHLTVLPFSHSTITKNICPGQSYLGHNLTGTYIDTLTGTNNCDSIRTLNLTLLTNPTTTITQSICLGQSYNGHTTTGTYIDTFNAANTCDSIRTLHLTVTNGIRTSYTQSICAGQSFDGLTQTGNYIDTFIAVGGCDSIRTLNLTVLNNVTSTISQNICQGQTYGGHSITGTFIDTLQAANSCDSVRTLHLTVLAVSRTTVAKSICPGQSYAGHTAIGTYIDTLNGANGCDSIRTLTLTVLPVVTSSISRAICQGQSYDGHTNTGTYVDTFTSANGCDSIRTLALTVSASITTTLSKSICQGQPYSGHDTTGTYIDSFTAIGGCDSVRTLHLTVTNNVVTSVNNNICQGQAYDGHTSTGTFIDTFASAAGCDSIRTLHLTVNPLLSDTFSHAICQGDNFNGHTTTGFYTDTLMAITGCDSLVTLHLMVTPLPATPTVNQQGDTLTSSIAYSYQWYRDSVMLSTATGRTIIITQNGNYTVVTGDSTGCVNVSAVLPVTSVGIQTVNGSESISIFPNPAKDQLTYFIHTGKAEKITIEINDITGNLVMSSKLDLIQGSNTGNLEISQLAAGYYEISFISDGLRNTKPIVKF